jgi:dipeptidase D
MNMKKKTTTFILIALLLISSLPLTGCGTSFDEEAANQLEKDVYGLYEDFKTIYAEADSEYEVSSRLFDWANDHDFVARRIGGGNLIITKPASVNDPSFPYTILQCTISKDAPKESSQKAAIALSTIMNLRENGKVGVLFTTAGDSGFAGAKRLDPKNLDCDYFIHLEYSETSAVNVGSAGTAEYEMGISYGTQTPTTTNAYRLSIDGLSEEDSSVLTGTHPNAILILSNFLIGCRASGMLVELADFDGGSSAEQYPGKASALILVNQNNEARLQARFASNLENFTKKYSDEFPDATYTLTSVETPKKVIQNDDAANMLSLLYTTINGVYKTSEGSEGGTTLAVANIGKLTTKSGQMRVRILARSVDEAVLSEMTESYHATAYLSDATFRVVTSSAVWPYDAENEFARIFVQVAKDAGLDGMSVKPTFLKSECVVFFEKKKDINMISFSVNNSDAFLNAKSLLFYITGLVRDQN